MSWEKIINKNRDSQKKENHQKKKENSEQKIV